MITIPRRTEGWCPDPIEPRCQLVGWLAAAGLALGAIGTGVQMASQNQAQRAEANARNEELYRQSQNQQKAAAIVAPQIEASSVDKALPAIQQAADNRAAEYNRITAAAAPTAPATRTVSSPFAAQTANQSALTAAWNRILAPAQARLGAFGDWGLARNIAQQRASQQLGTIASDARLSAGISGQEQQDASHAGDLTNAAGQLIGLAGRGLGTYASGYP